jgi:hypothetical protein
MKTINTDKIKKIMEIKTKNIIIYAAVAVGAYYIYQKYFKKGTPATGTNTNKKVAETPIFLPSTDGTTNQYPIAAVVTSSQEGRQPTGQKVRLKDGDAVKGVPETVYVLKGGEKHPVTGTWWFYNFGQDYSNLINVTDETLDYIKTGNTFTVNGQ